MPKTTGFSLLELLITLSLITILASLTLPSFKNLTHKTKSKTQATQLMQSLRLARSEAILRATPITLCQTSNNTTCSDTPTDKQILFTDPKNNATVTTEDNLLYLFDYPTQDGKLYWRSSLHRNYLSFYPSGSTRGEDGTFWYCQPEKHLTRWAVIVNQAGRARYVDDPKLLSAYPCG
jgi:type IV fimbrial biogenesis protein FimT